MVFLLLMYLGRLVFRGGAFFSSSSFSLPLLRGCLKKKRSVLFPKVAVSFSDSVGNYTNHGDGGRRLWPKIKSVV